jgi:uncharacterized protein (TIGR03067 family)
LNDETLFHLARQKPPQERAVFLDTACAGDIAQRQRLQVLLDADDSAGCFLQTPLNPQLPSGAAPPQGGTPPGKPEATRAETAHALPENLAFLAAPTRPGSIGRLGHYEVLEVVGKGGFGTVLKAFDEKLHRVVAIKVLSPAYADHNPARRRFIREARTAAVVKNEHVVAIHGVQDEAQPPYLVMEFIDGIALEDKIDRKGPLSLTEILRIGMQTAEGLAAAHKQGLVHRDVKPANILLENGVERVKLTDFGLARAVDDASVTQSGTVAGTPMYMSPEQAEGLQVDHRSDLFSLGTVLYAMCTGDSPFRASGTLAVLKRVIDASPRPIREINSEIPEWLCAIVARLHARKPEERFQTAQEVAELLGRRLAEVQAGRPIERTAPGRGESAGPAAPIPARTLWTHQRRIAGAALAALGGLFVAVAAMVFHLPAERIDPPGAPWLLLTVGLAALAAAVVFGFSSRRWRLAGVAALLGAASLTIAELTDLTHLFHPQRFWVTVVVDDPNLQVSIFAPLPGEETQHDFDTAFGEVDRPPGVTRTLLKRLPFGTHKLTLPAWTTWWFVCELDGQPVYQKLVRVDRPLQVELPWAAEFARKERQKLQGAWRAVAGARDGKAMARELIDAGDFRLHFDDDRATVRMAETQETRGTKAHGIYKLDVRKKPPALDLVGASDGKTLFCIYRWEGDRLQLCGSPKERPTDFTTSPGSGRMLLTLIGSQPGEAIWVQLFNGTDLAGWTTAPGQPGNWTVNDGAITCSGAQSHLFSERQLEHFQLRVSAKINRGGNSGVFFRSGFDKWWTGPAGKVPQGYKAQIEQEPGNADRTGSLFYNTLCAGVQESLIRPNEWFTLEILAQGNRLRVVVEGKTVVDWRETEYRPTRGHLALQHFGPNTQVSFRKVEVKLLPPAAPAPQTAAEFLPALVGVWHQQVTQKVLDGEPVNRQFTQTVAVEWVAGKKFLRQRTQTKPKGPDDLVVLTELPTGEIRTWSFDARGDMRGPGNGRWDPATRTATWTDLGAADMLTVKNVRFDDADTVSWELIHRHKDGKVVWELRGTMIRRAEPSDIVEHEPPGPMSKQFAALQRILGTWEGEAPDPDNPGPAKHRVTLNAATVLGGRFVEGREKTTLGGHEDYWLSTWDETLQAYRLWNFSTRWGAEELRGKLDPKTDLLTWRWNGRSPLNTRWEESWHFPEPNLRTWTLKNWDRDGKPGTDIQATFVRKAPGPW